MADLWPDAEIGEMISDGVVLSFEAETAIIKGDPVYLSSDMKVSRAGSAQNCIGITLKTVTSGEQCSVCVRGVVKVTFVPFFGVTSCKCGRSRKQKPNIKIANFSSTPYFPVTTNKHNF